MGKKSTLAACLLVAGCAAPRPAPEPIATRTVPAKCTACHLAPAEHSLAAERWDRYLKNHRRRLHLTDDEKAFLYDFLVGGAPPPQPRQL
jgi:hypothetical protein